MTRLDSHRATCPPSAFSHAPSVRWGSDYSERFCYSGWRSGGTSSDRSSPASGPQLLPRTSSESEVQYLQNDAHTVVGNWASLAARIPRELVLLTFPGPPHSSKKTPFRQCPARRSYDSLVVVALNLEPALPVLKAPRLAPASSQSRALEINEREPHGYAVIEEVVQALEREPYEREVEASDEPWMNPVR